ncbi:MAG: RsmB/NOP family class I SAM-dependent RNA methyltransferase [Verrucomicrobia bacterium]|nr:RsmB/NOP family class I SAM-dependent RNA methyltransferase [Verrucomicrobiota bacterium]
MKQHTPQHHLPALVARVIAAASRAKPADAVLRETLRTAGGLTAAESREISRAVFAYYRWLGWLDRKLAVAEQVERALELARRFADAPERFSEGELLARAVPAWAVVELNVAPDWAAVIQSEPVLWLRARRGQGGKLAKKLGDGAIHAQAAAAETGEFTLPDALIYEGEEDLFRKKEFQAGEFEIQDIASQAVGLLCDPKPGETWWDACAGEGGKTLHLSDLMQNKGQIWASDRAEWRLKKLKLRAGRANCFNYRAVLWDGGERLPMRTKFDGVLVDAPCSGTGTWQRNPHARWTTTPEDVRELAAVQERLLANVAPAVKPGGRLIYSVCTLARSETSAVAKAFSKSHPEFAPAPLASPFLPSASPSPQLWLWPQDSGGNGMFVAVWRRL